MSEIDAKAEEVSSKRGNHYERSGNGYLPKGVQDTLLVAAILGLVGAWWNFGKSIAVLQAAQEFQQRQIDREVSRLDKRQDTLEGKITRGGPDAPDQQ